MVRQVLIQKNKLLDEKQAQMFVSLEGGGSPFNFLDDEDVCFEKCVGLKSAGKRTQKNSNIKKDRGIEPSKLMGST